MKKILVTGANGQLGSSIKERVNAFPNALYQYIFTDSLTLDISNKNVVDDFFFTNTFDYVINCAAYTAVDKAEEEVERAFKVNADGPEFLAKASKEQGGKLIHISTDYVFDGEKAGAYLPEDLPNPINVYGKSKLEGEKRALENNPHTFVIRTSWVYSAYGNNFVKTMRKLFQEKDELNIVADQFGRPTDAYKLAQYIIEEIIEKESTQYGIRHYASEPRMSWYEFAQRIAEEENSSIKLHPINTDQYPTKAKRPKNSELG